MADGKAFPSGSGIWGVAAQKSLSTAKNLSSVTRHEGPGGLPSFNGLQVRHLHRQRPTIRLSRGVLPPPHPLLTMQPVSRMGAFLQVTRLARAGLRPWATKLKMAGAPRSCMQCLRKGVYIMEAVWLLECGLRQKRWLRGSRMCSTRASAGLPSPSQSAEAKVGTRWPPSSLGSSTARLAAERWDRKLGVEAALEACHLPCDVTLHLPCNNPNPL